MPLTLNLFYSITQNVDGYRRSRLTGGAPEPPPPEEGSREPSDHSESTVIAS